MRVNRIVPNLRVPDIEAAKSFCIDYLGLNTEEFNMGWMARYTCAATRANVQLLSTMQPLVKTRLSPSTPITSKVRMKKPKNSAMRSSIR